MVHYKIFLQRAYFAAICVLLKTPTANGIRGNLPEPNTIINFLQNVVGPYVDNLRKPNVHIFRTTLDSNIEKSINKKIEELKPLLQDNDESIENNTNENDNLILDGKDETTIIEFLPSAEDTNNAKENDKVHQSGSLKMDIKKYKKAKQKIAEALGRELVSQKTQHMVTKTLDNMIAQLIENQCTWKNTPNRGIMRTNDGKMIINKWHEEWIQLKNKFTKYINSDSKDTSISGAKLFQFFDHFHNLITHIAKHTESLTDRYKIVCQLVEHKNDVKFLRKGDNKSPSSKKKNDCDNFKVCSEELKMFITNFYTSLNNTAVSIFRNYAAMYMRDVNTDDITEKEHVVEVMHEISNLAENKITKTFIKESSKFGLNEKKGKTENIKALKSYIKRTVQYVKDHIKHILETGVVNLKAKLQTSVNKDLNVNLDLELRHLDKDYRGKLCKEFTTCNGRNNGRRNDVILAPKNLNKNSIYVQMRLALDDEIKNSLIKSKILDSIVTKKQNENKKTKRLETFTMRYTQSDDERKHFNVTRTTHSNVFNKGTRNATTYLSGVIVEVFNGTKKMNETIK